ncbi:hypothetical protein K1719_017836 [Acacia pycnantha]|nr:hypothetical protein K1719_017836 [Acacia pycnantha]
MLISLFDCILSREVPIPYNFCHATSATNNGHEVDLDFGILVTLACEEQEIARLVLSMMRKIAELTNVNWSALWHQLCASKDEIVHLREEEKAEISDMAKEHLA